MTYETLRFIFENYGNEDLLIEYHDVVQDRIVFRTTEDLNSRNPKFFLGTFPSMLDSIVSVTICSSLEKIYNHNCFGEFIIKNGTIKKISEVPFKLPETSKIKLGEIKIFDTSKHSSGT